MRKLIVDLHPLDGTIVRGMAHYADLSIAAITRYALRYYFLHGPWCVGGVEARAGVVGHVGELIVGPGYWEGLQCHENAAQKPSPPPSPPRRRKSRE